MYLFSVNRHFEALMKIDFVGKKELRTRRMEERASQGSWGGHMDVTIPGKEN
jgi:hypothetical protein